VSRRGDNRRRQEQIRRVVEEAYAGPGAELRGRLSSGDEVWGVGKIGMVLPAIEDRYPPALKSALARRRSASMSGQCDCREVVWEVTGFMLVFRHADDCPATDDNIDRLLKMAR
jgi:hypothetical protein